MTEIFDVVVAGGGPAGLAAAIAAARRGFRVAVVDASKPPVDKACGEGLMPDSLAVLRELGVRIKPEDGASFRGIRFVDGARVVESDFPQGTGIGVRRPVLHKKLAQHAERLNVQLFWNTAVRGLTQSSLVSNERTFKARWIVGADGLRSQIRRWAGLHHMLSDQRRLGFRQHFSVEPWSDFVEVHWSRRAQCYITPVAEKEICVVMITRDERLRFSHLPLLFPDVWKRLKDAAATSSAKGAMTVSRRMKHVCSENVALLGDAAGAVDAITGEGLCLAFQQAIALADSLACGGLKAYAAAHARIMRRPHMMARLMLLLDGRERLRARVMRSLTASPDFFTHMLAFHVGALNFRDVRFSAPLKLAYGFLVG